MIVNPTAIRVEACSICQLRCPLCPSTRGENTATVGRGYLRFDDFKKLIDRNPQIRKVELGNFGEVFLNKDLPKILEYAYAKGVTSTIAEGANLNDASDQVLEALVKYQTAVVRCAIDGITQATYSKYRLGGDLKKVLRNIQKINLFKEKHHSTKPRLIFQFIVFGHNEHEIERAILLSKMLKMEIFLKLNFSPNALAVHNQDRVRQLVGYANRAEFLEREGKHYHRFQCYELWNSPQVNWDGKLLGCSRNIWGIFGDNVFQSDLASCINNEKMQYARKMLMGLVPAREDMPCLGCSVYQSMVKTGNWITEQECLDATPEMDSWIRPIKLPLEESKREGWRIHEMFRGSIGSFDQVSSHIAVLSHDNIPHPPHQHSEEELKIVLSGELANLTADVPANTVSESNALGCGSFVYHGPQNCHTIRCVSPGPSTYLVFRWRRALGSTAHKSFIFDSRTADLSRGYKVSEGFTVLPIDELQRYGNLRSHLSLLQPGAGYLPHRDPHDIIVVLLSGTVETLHRQVESPTVIFYASNALHGIQNVGKTPASYLVFEFDGT